MLGNCEKMLLISSSPPPNEWPQNLINPIDDPESNNSYNKMTTSLTATATNPTGVDHHHQKVDHHHHQQHQQQQKQQESLKCPRCDSTNTKFCYYNNYSLSQPRHFCKACKRYWTRGGTLRNVPVGGGCRKNKRVKRSTNNNSSSSITTTNTTSLNSANNNNNINNEGSVNSGTSSSVNNSTGSIHELISSGSNPLFYGFPASNTMNFPFSRYDLQNPPHINGLGLGFSSGLVHNMSSMNIHHSGNNNNNDNNNNNNKQIFQELMSSNPLLSHYATTTTTTGTTATTTTAATTTTPQPPPPPTISTLLGSTLHQMKGGGTLLPSYESDLHMKGSGNNGMFMKEVKMEFQGANRSFDTNHHWDTTHNQMDQPMGSSNDPSIIWGATNGANLGAWLDPSNNLGSSVPSLI